MTALVWDKPEDRTYESGVEKGVLYLPDGSAVPWNGLVEVIEKTDKESTSVYFDGVKISELVNLGGFLGTLKAITFPDAFYELEGMAMISQGLYLGEQQPKVFGLCYRSLIGDGLTTDAGYKLHVLYNVIAVPNDKTFTTITKDPSVTTFDWEIAAMAEEVPGFKPTAHISIDSRHIDPALLLEIETILYGDDENAPTLIPIIDFVNYLYFGYKYKIVDNGDGTWTATSPVEGLIEIDPDGSWTLNDANAVYLSADVYQISDSHI